ncbi:MAG: site-2 protease family protein [Clostridia bacterium]|nr:site-2 protease family protein [Clostridia bacterium]
MSFYIFHKKCRVKVSFYFFALLCVAAFFDRSRFMMWGMLASLLHECGHIAAMLPVPEQVPREICITPFGIRIESSPLSEFGRGHFLILAAGSGVNFICAAVTFGFLPAFAAVSLVLGILNILPVEGMDGGGMIRVVLERIMPQSAADRMVRILSWMTLGAMLLMGIYVLAVTGHNFTLLGAALILVLTLLRKTPSI